MLRKLIIGAIVLNFVYILCGIITTTENTTSSFAANTTIGGTATARVPAILELVNSGIRKIPANATGTIDPWSYPSATSFDFGELVYKEQLGALVGEYYYCTLMIPVTSGRSFTISETGTALTGTAGTIPDNRFVVASDYQAKDRWDGADPASEQGPMPSGAFLGAPTTAVGTKVIYTDPIGEARIIRGFISIPPKPADADYPYNYRNGYDTNGNGVGSQQLYTGWEQLKLGNAPPGDYSGSVTFTLSLS